MSGAPLIDFYYAPTPNGWKIAIFLEEAALPYETHLMRLSEGDQFDPDYLKISPNAKMPAIVDRETGTSVFESGAILIYLAEKTGRFLPDPALRLEMLQWLFWQAANQGPLAGQLSHFVNYAPEGQDYGLRRYRGEYERNLAVLETRLEGRDWIVGEGYSIVDMMCFPWAFIAKPLGVSLDDFPNVAGWRGRIKDRPAVRRAIDLHKDAQNRGRHTASNNDMLFNAIDLHKDAQNRGRHTASNNDMLFNQSARSFRR